MRMSSNRIDATLFSALLLPVLASASGSFDCSNIRVDGRSYHFDELGGPRSVMHSLDQLLSWKNTTYTIDICQALKRSKEIPKGEECPNGTRVCAIERVISKDTGTDIIERVFPIAGELKEQGGRYLDAKWEKFSTTTNDVTLDGVRVDMNGGFKVVEGDKRWQKATVEFVCDKTRTGLEGLLDPEDKYEGAKKRRDEAPKGDEKEVAADDTPKTSSLEFVKYAKNSGQSADVLELRWRTKHACADDKQTEDAKPGEHWGFFTWFIIIAFLSTSTYLIFGSWLNYNRYGARGWDLLPHGDTIRDVPYLMKDWSRRVLTTVQGGGTRGGYAAV